MRAPGFAAALDEASPVLARRVREICDGRKVPERAARRAVLSTMRYVLRASGRATPFGLFAGVAPARIGQRTAARVDRAHRAVAKVDAGWLTAVIERLEAEPALRPHLMMLANNLAFERDGNLVLEHRPGGSAGGAPTHVSVRATTPVRAAMNSAREQIRLEDLAAKLTADFPGVPANVVDALLGDLVTQRLLLTSLRPAMTTTDPLGYLLAQLETMAAAEVTDVAGVVESLHEIADGLARHNTAATAAMAADQRERLAATMTTAMIAVCPAAERTLAVDLRMHGDLTVPHEVATEAANAAAVLVRLAAHRSLNAGWDSWHSRFLERYGPRALVPLRDAVDPDIGLGYPAGYLGGAATPPPGPRARPLTDRDVKLLALAQRAALRHEGEIVLDDALVAHLAETAAGEERIQPTTELTVRIHAPTAKALDNGDFTLTILGVSRTAGTMTGRFLDLFDAEARERMSVLYANRPTTSRSALTAQISAPPRYPSTENVARTPRVMAHLLPIGEYYDDGENLLALDDIAVTADAHHLYLVSRSRRRPVEPVVLNAVEPIHQTHPLVRFLAEAPSALSVPCTAFDWGAAAGLAFLPALRYGRTILCPARWLLTTADLPGAAADWQTWDIALTTWRSEVNAPRRAYLGDGDQRIVLDLAEPAHRALLRAQVERSGTAVLRAAPETDAAGWIGGHTCEIVVPLFSTAAPADPSVWLEDAEPVGRDHAHLPGCDGRIYLKLYSHPDRQNHILTHHLPRLLNALTDQAQWWFLRHHDPDAHLRVRLKVPADTFASTAEAIGDWSRRLRAAGLIARIHWDTYFPETARFGGEAAMSAAEAYFAADSAAALAQLTASGDKNGPDIRAVTAASLLDIALALIGDAAEAMSWLIGHTRTAPSAPDRALYDQAVSLANPSDQRVLDALPTGEHILSCWTRRREALGNYRTVLQENSTMHAHTVLPDLLHLHHVRIAGIGLDAERKCLHLARAAALSWTARAKSRS